MTEGWQRLHALEEQAISWLSTHPLTAGTYAFFDVFNDILTLRHSETSGKLVSINEAFMEAMVCLGRGCYTMPLPLPASPVDCACAELWGVSVDNLFLSGSVRENSCVSLVGTGASDVDIMIQLGAVTVEGAQHVGLGAGDDEGEMNEADGALAAGGASCREEAATLSGDDSGSTHGRETGALCCHSGISVVLEKTSHQGFYLLRHPRLASCTHPGRLPFSPQRVIGMIDSFRESITAKAPSFRGPSVSTTVHDLSNNPRDIDLVACLPCPSWPSSDFASRPRASGHPSPALVARLCRTPAFLVPVGFPGSETEELEWRLSFSRHEYIVYHAMTRNQRVCLTALKYCRVIVGEVAKPLKSFYMKTALMWLAEERAADRWKLQTMHESLLLILHYLEICMRRGYLPCYFWPEMNLLDSKSAAERAEMRTAVSAMRERLLPAILALLADWLGQPVPRLALRLLFRGDCLTPEEFSEWTVTSAACQSLAWPARHYVTGAADGDGDSDVNQFKSVLWNMLAFGQDITAGSVAMYLPFFSGLALTLDVAGVLTEREDFNPFSILQSMSQRGSRLCGDSWLPEK